MKEPALITAGALYQNASPKSLFNLEVCVQSNQKWDLLVSLFHFAWSVLCLDTSECEQAGTGDNIVDRVLGMGA